MSTELGEYTVKKEGVDSTVRLGLDRGYLQGDKNGDLQLVAPQNATPEEQKIYDEFASTFNSLPNLSEERKLLEKKWKTQAENTLLDNDKSNDVTSMDTASVWSTFDQSNKEKQASAQSLIGEYNKAYEEQARKITGKLTGSAKEFFTDYTDIQGNLEISPDNYDNWIKSEGLTKENVQEADRLRNKLSKDKRLAHLTNKQRDWVIGSSLKRSKGLGQDDAIFGEAFDYATSRGIWVDDKVNTVIEEQLNKLEQVISASDELRQEGLKRDQLINDVNAELGFIQGRSNLIRALN
jgi:G:T/U-mismatch repair DNA glycosylase